MPQMSVNDERNEEGGERRLGATYLDSFLPLLCSPLLVLLDVAQAPAREGLEGIRVLPRHVRIHPVWSVFFSFPLQTAL